MPLEHALALDVPLSKQRMLCLQVWDLGGQANLRPFWATYYQATDAVMMMVDSTDRARISIAKVLAGS